jgi:hypothetical protein
MVRRPFVHPDDVHKQVDDDLAEEFPIYLDTLFDSAIGMGMIPIKHQWPTSLKRRLAAAFISNNLGIGMDYALKRYVGNTKYPQSENRLDIRAENIILFTLDRIPEIYAFEKPGDANPNDFFFSLSFLKSTSTLSAAHTMAQQGYLSETITLCRMALETLAWSVAASHASDHNQILKISTTRAITIANKKFKKFGRLYGLASKFTHWEPEVHLSFVSMGENGSEIVTRSVPHKICSLLFLLGCLQLCTVCFPDHMARFFPDIDTSDCDKLSENIRSVAIEISNNAMQRTKFDKLLSAIVDIWLNT